MATSLILPSAARAAGTFFSDTVPVLPGVAAVAILIRTTASSGTPSNAVTVQWSVDGTNFLNADPADSFTAITGTANGVLAKSFAVKGPYFRVSNVITGGTPSLTFSINSHQETRV